MSDGKDGEPQGAGKYKWRVLGVVVFGIFMVILDTTVVNVAFPTMRDQFHASLAESQWIVSLYMLALGVVTPMAGLLSDRFGMKRMYLGGLGLFVAGSLGSGLAPSLPFLILTRALQGAGGGIALPLGTAMLFAAFPPSEQGLALGIYGVALLTAPALGPILGGYLVDRSLWRWIFFINVPIGIAGIILGSFLLRESERAKENAIDVAGIVASVIGYGAMLYAASVAANAGWASAGVLVPFAVGAAGLGLLIAIELRRRRDPLLDFHLFGHWTFLNASLVGWVTVMALFGAEFLMPIYLQMLRGRNAFTTGLILLPLAIVAGITTPTAGWLYDKIGPRALVIFGFVVLCINTWQLSELTGTTSIRWVVFLMALRGLALGSTVQSTYATALGTVPRERVARGSSLINSTRFVVQSIAVALFATIIASGLSPASHATQARMQTMPAQALIGRGLCESTVGGKTTRTTGAALERACAENMLGFERAYRVTFWFAVLALILGALLPGWPFGWAGRAALAGGAGGGGAEGGTEASHAGDAVRKSA